MDEKESATEEMVRLLPNNIELSKNAKGEYSWTIKLRFPEGCTPQEMTDRTSTVNKAMVDRFGGK